MTVILGISAFYHDSAAALIVDGQIVAAAAEERFTRIKHDSGFPSQAIAYCLEQAGVTPNEIDFIGFHEKPLLKVDRLLETYLAFAPIGYKSFRAAIPEWVTTKLRPMRLVRQELERYRKRIVYCPHHQSHAASAFFASPFEEAAILTVDGVGEWSTATVGIGHSNKISASHELRFPHSLGLVYSAFTSYCGFGVNSGEYKLMGLAAHGEPVYRDLILDKIVSLKSDGSLNLDMRYFNYCQGLTMTSSRLEKLLGFAPRKSDEPITDQHKNLAASIQSVTEEAVLRMVNHLHELTSSKNLVMAGGVALNCVANGRIMRESRFDQVWVQPAAGDDGGALGVALFIWHQLLDKERPGITDTNCDPQNGSLLGPSFDDERIRAMLVEEKAQFQTADDEQKLCEATAKMIAEGKVVAWFQGRMEFGPRALGNRSILADPRDSTMQTRLNKTVKNRESFRPFAPAVLAEKAHSLFDIDRDRKLPYMLFTVSRCGSSDASLPAIEHVDRSARIQTVDTKQNPIVHQLLTAFDRLTGCPVLVNTSFNVRGEPIVCTPEDAYCCFLSTDIDVLVMGKHIVQKQSDAQTSESKPLAEKTSLSEKTGATTKRRLKPRWFNLQIPWNPSSQLLKRFALSFVFTLPLVAFIFRRDWKYIAFAISLAILINVAAMFLPGLVRFVYRLLLLISLPFVFLLSEILLGLTFYLVVSPIGLALRLFGYDSLSLRSDREAKSFWGKLNLPSELKHYFRRY